MTDVIFDASDNSVTDTSKQTYQDLKESGELADQAQKVYEAIEAMQYAACSINELANEALAGWQKSTISGRIGDLRDKDLVEMAGKRPDKYSGRKCKTWMVSSRGERES
jgi:hypothetical protein